MDCVNFVDRLARQNDCLLQVKKNTLSFRLNDLKSATINSGPLHHMNKKNSLINLHMFNNLVLCILS